MYQREQSLKIAAILASLLKANLGSQLYFAQIMRIHFFETNALKLRLMKGNEKNKQIKYIKKTHCRMFLV